MSGCRASSEAGGQGLPTKVVNEGCQPRLSKHDGRSWERPKTHEPRTSDDARGPRKARRQHRRTRTHPVRPGSPHDRLPEVLRRGKGAPAVPTLTVSANRSGAAAGAQGAPGREVHRGLTVHGLKPSTCQKVLVRATKSSDQHVRGMVRGGGGYVKRAAVFGACGRWVFGLAERSKIARFRCGRRPEQPA